MRTKSRAQQMAQRTRKRPKGTRYTPRTRPIPIGMDLINSLTKQYLVPHFARDLYRSNTLVKSTGINIPISKQLLEDAWQ